MKYFFTADTHFDHHGIIKFCNRPFKDIKEMNTEIIKRWNKTVSKNDTVFFLGDFSWKNHNKFLKLLNGNIVLIKGNHDKQLKTVIEHIIIYHHGKYWHLMHNPLDAELDYNLCGHVHTLWKIKRFKKEPKKIIVNVGMDVWDFKPITMKTIMKAIEGEAKK